MRTHWLLVLMLAGLIGCTEKEVDQRRGSPLYSGGGSGVTTADFSVHHGRLRSLTDTSEMTSVHAVLLPDTGGSTVSFNGLTLDETVRSGHTNYSAYLSPGSSYYHWGGASNYFGVSGAWHAGFADSLPGPAAKTLISSPAIDNTVSKSSGFTVSWTPTTSSAAVAITLVDTGTGGRACGVKTFTSDPGSATFSPSDLSCLNIGRLMLTVDRGYYRSDSVSATHYIQLTIGSSDAIWLQLVP